MRRSTVALAVPPFPPFGLGLARAGSFNNPASLGDSVALIRLALELGAALLDTANIYGQGDSERAIGRALRNRRDEAIIVTKGGQTFSAAMRLLRPLKPLLRPMLARSGRSQHVAAARASAMRADWSAAGLVASLDGSLRRLRTDRVDVFLLHSPPAEVLARPDAAEALARIQASGRAVLVGAACDDAAALDAALALPRLDVLELPWTLLAGMTDGPRAAVIRGRRIRVIAREVLLQQPCVPPAEAFAHARRHPLITTTLVGSRRPERLRAIVTGSPA